VNVVGVVVGYDSGNRRKQRKQNKAGGVGGNDAEATLMEDDDPTFDFDSLGSPFETEGGRDSYRNYGGEGEGGGGSGGSDFE